MSHQIRFHSMVIMNYLVPTLQVVATSSTITEFKSQEKETATLRKREKVNDPSKSSPTSGAGNIEGYAENREVLGENVRTKEEEDSGKRQNGETQMIVDVESKENTEGTDVKVPNQIPLNKSVGRRYPRRNIIKKQYFEDSLPKDDDYMCE